MAKQDFYELLGVQRGASPDDIKKAYRKLAMQHHPDKNPGDKAAEHRFKELSEAYDILKDDQKRAAYDRFGHAAFEGAFKGKQTSVRVPSLAQCDTCHGSGAEAGSKPVTCPTCKGHGRVRAQQGFFTIERTCVTCQGAGRVIEKPCRTCAGQGRVRKEKTLSVSIPPGVEDGTRIRLAGEGESGLRGAAAGDLYIFLSLAPHRLFQRDGANIHCRVPIPMATAALGGALEVPVIDGGRAKITVPAGTQSGHQFRLKGKGMSVLRSGSRGDMYVQAVVETPMNLTKRQQELLKEFEKEGEHAKTNPESEGFFSRVKEFFEDL